MSLVEPAFVVGIDGGGSRCRARLCDRSGRLRGEAEGGAANVYLDFDGAVSVIQATIDAVFRSAGLDPHAFGESAVGLGLAGASSAAIADRVSAALPGFATITVVHDGVAACFGAHAGDDGGIVIAGTGSSAVLWLGGRPVSFGGRGFILGDDGSGAVMGRALWRRALRAHDGLEPATPLLAALMRSFDDDPRRVISWGRTAPSHQFAAYATQAFAAAAERDTAALAVVTEAANAIGELILALHGRGAPRIALVGGMAAAITPYLPGHITALLTPPRTDALDGALFLAGLSPGARLRLNA